MHCLGIGSKGKMMEHYMDENHQTSQRPSAGKLPVYQTTIQLYLEMYMSYCSFVYPLYGFSSIMIHILRSVSRYISNHEASILLHLQFYSTPFSGHP
jgi:hypothetical protein